MLSRVLRGADNPKTEPVVFDNVTPDSAGEYSGTQTPAARVNTAGVHEDTSNLRERLLQAEAAQSEVKRKAFEEGRRAGEQQARGELEPILARLSAGLGELAELRSNLRRGAERDVVSLAILIARRVLHREINVDQDALTAIARVAFDRLARAESYRVRVHPRFAEAIRGALPASTRSHVEIDPDPTCAPGALIIQTPEGSIDASIDTQLAEIERGLADRLQVSKR